MITVPAAIPVFRVFASCVSPAVLLAATWLFLLNGGALHAQTEPTPEGKAAELLSRGRYQQALEVYQEIVSHQKRALEEVHTVHRDRDAVVDISDYVLSIRSAIIGQLTVYEELGDLESAEKCCLDLLDSTESRLGHLHPLTLEALLTYAHVREQQGGWSDAHLSYRWCAEVASQLEGEGRALRVDAALRLGELLASAGDKQEALAWFVEAVKEGEKTGGETWVETERALAEHRVRGDVANLASAVERLDGVRSNLESHEKGKSLRLKLAVTTARIYHLAGDHRAAVSRAEEAAKTYGDRIELDDCVLHGQLMLLAAQALISAGDYEKSVEWYSLASEILSKFASPIHPVRAEMHSTLAEIYLLRSRQDTAAAQRFLSAANQLCVWVNQRYDDRPNFVPPSWHDSHLRTHRDIAVLLQDEKQVTDLERRIDKLQEVRSKRAVALEADRRRYRYAQADAMKDKAKAEAELESQRLADRRGSRSLTVSFSAPTFELMQHRAKQNRIQFQNQLIKHLNPHTMGNFEFYQYQRSFGY